VEEEVVELPAAQGGVGVLFREAVGGDGAGGAGVY
jgi:hypothetical protein